MASTFVRRTSGTALCPLILKSSLKPNRLKCQPISVVIQEFQPSPLHNVAVCRISAVRWLSLSAPRRAEATSVDTKLSTASPSQTSSAEKQEPLLEYIRDGSTYYRERYIPITRQSLIRHLGQEKDFLTEGESKLFSDFVRSLDSVLVTKYQGVLEELKTLFDPINPDKDTIKSREWTRKEKLDNEFLLLQKLEEVMVKANFHELPKKKVEKFLRDHEAQERVRVSVDPSRYDVLRFWALGHDIPELKLSFSQRIMNAVLRRGPAKPKIYFKRVVVALRLKNDSKLILKAFKEVPVQSLEMLLPDGTIRMRAIDMGLLASTTAVAGFGILAKMVTVLASLQIDWTLALSLVTGTLGFRVWSTYRNRRNAYLLDVSRTLYFKNIANNQGLLTLLVDRAEDESLKEALLTYIFLLSSTRKTQSLFSRFRAGGLSAEELKAAVENWLEKRTGVRIDFDSSEAVKLLQDLGLLSEKDNKYQVLPLDVAARLLPPNELSIIARRTAEVDITGIRRDDYLETEDEYKSSDIKTRRYGWF